MGDQETIVYSGRRRNSTRKLHRSQSWARDNVLAGQQRQRDNTSETSQKFEQHLTLSV